MTENEIATRVIAAHKKRVQTYLRLTGCRLGYLLNFGEDVLKPRSPDVSIVWGRNPQRLGASAGERREVPWGYAVSPLRGSRRALLFASG